MYCRHCGKEIGEGIKYCPNCGSQNQESDSFEQHTTYYQGNMQTNNKESSLIGILAIVFSIVMTGVGLILSIVGLCTCKSPENRTNCKIGLGISIALIFISIMAFLIFFIFFGEIIYGLISA